MHRIVKAHLDTFSKNNGFESHDEPTQFELFVNFSVITSKTGTNFELNDVTTSNQDDGIDGIAVLIDEEVIASDEDASTVFKTERRNHDVEIIFIQSKTSDSLNLGDFLKFKDAILRFVQSDKYKSKDDVENNSNAIFNTCLKNVPKIRDGKPSITALFVSLGTYSKPKEFERAKAEFEKQIESLGYFSKIDIQFLGRDEITSLWVSTYSGVKTQLPISSYAPLPEIAGVEEAYLVVASAKNVVENLLMTEDGGLRSQVFEENVRAFLGKDNPVNKSIAETLSDNVSSTRFPVLNNGITIVSQDVRVQGNIFHLENYQIVNGCQTSNVLFENRNILTDKIMVNLKIVETSDEDVFSELVRATNSQSKIEENQFFSLRPIVRKIEHYFDSFEGQDGRIYLERRDRQFIGKDIPNIRIFSVQNAAQCITSMFFNRPDLAYRYPKQMYEQFGEKIFSNENKEIVFYSSCLALYRLHLLASNGTIPQNMRKFKWHILALLKEGIAGATQPDITSKKIEPYCQKIVDALSKHDLSVIDKFQKVVASITAMGEISGDRLKRQGTLEDIRSKYRQSLSS